MIFNKTAENVDSQTTNTSYSTMAEQPCETWKLYNMAHFNALEFNGDKIH